MFKHIIRFRDAGNVSTQSPASQVGPTLTLSWMAPSLHALICLKYANAIHSQCSIVWLCTYSAALKTGPCLQGRNGDVVVRADGNFKVDEPALVQRLYQRRIRVAQPNAARPRRLCAHGELRRRQVSKLHLTCSMPALFAAKVSTLGALRVQNPYLPVPKCTSESLDFLKGADTDDRRHVLDQPRLAGTDGYSDRPTDMHHPRNANCR